MLPVAMPEVAILLPCILLAGQVQAQSLDFAVERGFVDAELARSGEAVKIIFVTTQVLATGGLSWLGR